MLFVCLLLRMHDYQLHSTLECAVLHVCLYVQYFTVLVHTVGIRTYVRMCITACRYACCGACSVCFLCIVVCSSCVCPVVVVPVMCMSCDGCACDVCVL